MNCRRAADTAPGRCLSGGVILVAAAALVGGCSGGGDVADAPSTPTTSAASTEADAPDASDEPETVEVSTLDGDECPGDTEGADFPAVVGVTFTPADHGTWDVAVTVCSLYDSPDRYADAWRVTTPDGEELGVRELLHDHAGEQPFTRSSTGPVTIPEGVTTVTVEARDQTNGWGGTTLDVELG